MMKSNLKQLLTVHHILVICCFMFVLLFVLSSCSKSTTEVYPVHLNSPTLDRVKTPTIVVSLSQNSYPDPTISLTNRPLPTKETPLIPTQPSPAETTAAFFEEMPPSGWIAFASFNSYPNTIEAIKTNGEGHRIITDRIQFPDSIDWSPDGQWIAVNGSLKNDSANQIFIMRPDGTGFRQVTFSQEYKSFVSWSADSRLIIFTELVDSETWFSEWYELDLTSGELKKLTTPVRDDISTWAYSPQGDMIAYLDRSTPVSGAYPYLWVMEADGSNPRRLLDIPVYSFFWSPGGSQLIIGSPTDFNRGTYKCTDLFITNVDGSDLRSLTESADQSEYIGTWSPGGDWLAFQQDNACGGGVIGQQIYLIRLDGNGLMKLPNTSERSAMYPAWSPLPELEPGKTYSVTESGAGVNLRSEPTVSAEGVDQLIEAEQILVLDGPITAGEYLWWRVRVVDSELEGWVAEVPGWFARAW